MLELAGCGVQDMKDQNFSASRGVALREFPLRTGFADYMLFVDRRPRWSSLLRYTRI
jgi:type I restriction enzyme R subunit